MTASHDNAVRPRAGLDLATRGDPAHLVAHRAATAGELGRLAVLGFHRAQPHPGRGADILTELLVHDLDQALWIAGPATGLHAVSSGSDTPYPVATCQVVLTHASGAISHVRGYWGPPDLPSWSGFHLAGTTGLLRHDTRRETGFTLTVAGGVTAATTAIPLADDGEDDGPAATAAEVEGALALCRAAADSLRSGRRITIAEGA